MLLAILMLAMAPSVLPTWRSTLVAAGLVCSLLLAGFFWSLKQIDAMATGEGPAFFGTMFVFALAAFHLAASCACKLVIACALCRLRPYAASRLRATLVGAGLCIAAIAAWAAHTPSSHRGFACWIGMLALWLAITAWRTPGDSPELGLRRAGP